MTTLPSYWSGVQVGRFSTASLKAPAVSDFQALAVAYVSRVAPDLPALPARVLANSVVESLLDNDCTGWQLPSSLAPYKTWLWPELAKKVPFSLDGFHLGIQWRLWESINREYEFEARELQRALQTTTFGDWFFSAKMTQVTKWRKAYLPELKGRVLKVELLWQLRNLQPFPVQIRDEFAAWQREVRDAATSAMQEANKPPVPRHLEWLAGLVERSLRSHHYLHYSCAGPAAHERLAGALHTKSIDIDAAFAEVRSTLNLIFDKDHLDPYFLSDEYKVGVQQAKQMLLDELDACALDVSNGFSHVLKACAPLVELSECRDCKRPTLRGGKLPPFGITCSCTLPRYESYQSHLAPHPRPGPLDMRVWVLRLLTCAHPPSFDIPGLVIACHVKHRMTLSSDELLAGLS